MSRIFAPADHDGWLYDYNPEANPEKCGLTMLVSLEDPKACYSFDTIIVVIDNATGDLYGAHDAGCSCPTPFEDIKGLGDMVPIRTVEDFWRLVKTNTEYGSATWPSADVYAAARKVREHLKK